METATTSARRAIPPHGGTLGASLSATRAGYALRAPGSCRTINGAGRTGAMALMPLGFVIGWGTILLSLGLLGGGGYLIWGWAQGTLVGTSYLVSGVLMIAWSIFGRFLVLLLRPPATDEPHAMRGGDVQRVPRPDGTELQVEFYGPPDAPLIVMTHGW